MQEGNNIQYSDHAHDDCGLCTRVSPFWTLFGMGLWLAGLLFCLTLQEEYFKFLHVELGALNIYLGLSQILLFGWTYAMVLAVWSMKGIPYQDTYCVIPEEVLHKGVNPSNYLVTHSFLFGTSDDGSKVSHYNFPFYTFGKLSNCYFHEAAHIIEISTVMTGILFLSILGYAVCAWGSGISSYPSNLIPFFALLCFLLFPFVPFIPPYWTTRVSFGVVFSQVMLAVVWPFFGVDFVHVLIGDALTSASLILWNVELGLCYSITGFLSIEGQCEGNSFNLMYIQPLILLLPFWIRFIQCFYRYVCVCKQISWVSFQHLVNAGKYFSCLLVVITSALNSVYGDEHDYLRWIWLATLFLKTFYCYAWDIKMDWDLGKVSPDGRFPMFLREETYFAPYVYYVVMVTNLIMRFSWATALSPHLKLPKYIGTLLALVEILRRAQWFVFRTENEFLQVRNKRRKVVLEINTSDAASMSSILRYDFDSIGSAFSVDGATSPPVSEVLSN